MTREIHDVEITGLVGYITYQGVLHLFRTKEELQDFANSHTRLSQLGWIEKVVIVGIPDGLHKETS